MLRSIQTLLIATAIVLLKSICLGQISEDWALVRAKSLYEFSYPENLLEIQGDKQKFFVDVIKRSFTIEFPPVKLVLQQKGFNEGSNSSEYVRVLVEHLNGVSGDFLPSKLTKSSLTLDEQTLILDAYKSGISENLTRINSSVQKWISAELIMLDNVFCIHLCYLRKSVANNSNIYVNYFVFPDDSQELYLTLACNEVNSTKWIPIFERIVKSFHVY